MEGVKFKHLKVLPASLTYGGGPCVSGRNGTDTWKDSISTAPKEMGPWYFFHSGNQCSFSTLKLWTDISYNAVWNLLLGQNTYTTPNCLQIFLLFSMVISLKDTQAIKKRIFAPLNRMVLLCFFFREIGPALLSACILWGSRSQNSLIRSQSNW